jgi:translation initiation factor 6
LQAIDRRLKIAGSSLLGVFARCTEKVVLVPPEVGPEAAEALEKGLEVAVVRAMVGGSSVLGSLISANSQGFVVSYHANDDELKRLSEHGRPDWPPGSPAGNVILPTAPVGSSRLSVKAMRPWQMFYGRGVRTIGGLKTVGDSTGHEQRSLVHPVPLRQR